MLHSFPRTVSVQWRVEWCFSFFLLSGSKPWSGSSLFCVCPSSMLHSTVRAADALQTALKTDPAPREGLKAAEGRQGSQNIVYLCIPFIFSRGSSLNPLFPPIQVVQDFGCEWQRPGQWEGRARGQLVPFPFGMCPGCHSAVPHLYCGCFPSGSPAPPWKRGSFVVERWCRAS